MASPIKQLHKQGQSVWLDNIRRQLITSGELARLRDEGVTGVTSNPTIFEKAVSGSTDYDEALVRMVQGGQKPDGILWEMMLEDIRAAADVFRPVYDQTDGGDGYVSIEVSPVAAHDTKKTVSVARDLWRRADRPNVMVKIPATKAGLPAIRQMIGEGVNINVTLIFAIERYDQVVDAYLSGLEDLQKRGGNLNRVASVASFFVSRVDSKVDKLLEERIQAANDPAERRRLTALLGKAAIANSKTAYQHFQQLHAGPRWKALLKAGARRQRCLWASTSTKDPRYADTMYVEELIGPETVDTVPPATLDAFREHGEVRRSLDENLDLAMRQLAELASLGIDLTEVTRQLEVEGADAFEKSFDSLLGALKEAAKEIKGGRGPRMWHSLGPLQPAVDKTVAKLQKQEAPKKLWSKDPSLFVAGTEPQRWMGWLDLPEKMQDQAGGLLRKARDARTYEDVVLLGMGGSSLAPDVFRATFGARKGWPRFHVLDTTDPGSVLGLRRRIDPAHSLFIAASKSGGTTETLSHLAYFWEAVKNSDNTKPERNFAVITDPGSSLEQLAAERDFRWVFLNPSDIGGRYSALSSFGLVPAALMGVDVPAFLARAQEMAHACDAGIPVEKNPGAWLGATLGTLAAGGRDKLTLVMSPKLATFGYWLEQLVAESTGKQGKGIIPIEGERLGTPAVYGQDRVFVYTRLARDADNPAVTALEKAGQPVITLTLRDEQDLAGEMLLWEIATALAGSVLGIDPFHQPNVQESKDNTTKALAAWQKEGAFPAVDQLTVGEAGAAVSKLLKKRAANSYFAVMSYTSRSRESEAALSRIRTHVRDHTKLATTAGYGPRFLHSTGQLHKGGPATGLFLQIVQEDARDAPIPGEPYSFSILKQAQALGDRQSLQSRGLPTLRINLGRSPRTAWRELVAAIETVGN